MRGDHQRKQRKECLPGVASCCLVLQRILGWCQHCFLVNKDRGFTPLVTTTLICWDPVIRDVRWGSFQFFVGNEL